MVIGMAWALGAAIYAGVVVGSWINWYFGW